MGFSEFEFNEDLDFTKEIYGAYPSFDRNFDITYVASVQVIPSYVNHINYKTNASNYKMKLSLNGISHKEISEYGRDIVLNSLLFDPNTLPAKLDKEHIFDQLLDLKKEQEENSSIIRNVVDLSISVSDLEYQFNNASSTINRLEGVKNKEQLVAVLSNIKEELEKLKTLSTKYESCISQEEPLLKPEVLKKEKTLYLKRRYMENIDLC